MNRKVIVGMSGGVDSSVTAYILKEQGYEVEGISLILFDQQSRKNMGSAPCCSKESVADAVKTARAVGITHNIIDVRDSFAEKVIAPFIDAYSNGITPNPCILCNRHIKFRALMEAADKRGFGFIATGHYAGVLQIYEEPRLIRGLDPAKDQSYVLHCLTRDIIARLILPLSKKTKTDIRDFARRLRLPAANRPESQEICFIEERNYVDFMEDLSEKAKGPIIDIETGKVLGSHSGIHLYTIGQRKRLPATGKPFYVVRIDPMEKTVYIGSRELALMKMFTVCDVNWLITQDEAEFRATVKVRSNMKDEPASLRIAADGTVRVEYDKPQWAPAPGQSAVFYCGNTVIGGGIIMP